LARQLSGADRRAKDEPHSPGASPPTELKTLGKALVITEKPSVARDITDVLGGFTDHEGYFESDTHLVTFAAIPTS